MKKSFFQVLCHHYYRCNIVTGFVYFIILANILIFRIHAISFTKALEEYFE